MAAPAAPPSERPAIAIHAVPGRTCQMADFYGCAPVWRAMEGRTFDTAEDLARFVGQHYGWRSNDPGHPGPRVNGIAWKIVDAMTLIYRDTDGGRRSYFTLVPGLAEMTNGYHADLVGLAFEAAGLVVLPVEAL